ncbi:MAG: Cupin 2 conserved barrel domain protein [Rhodoglobus sp.]|nr:Cupin 2 conserved barrel domain protein [Rhodoglobus sp.]
MSPEANPLHLQLAAHEWTDRSEAAIFSGGAVSVSGLQPVAASIQRMTGVVAQASLVRFAPGAHTRLHTHDTDQILVVMEGRGHIGSPGHDRVVGPGDIVVIPAGSVHYHGAAAGESMAHLMTLFGSATTVLDDIEWPPRDQGEA